jgi:membrane protein implicated in regulation of membrane protease activity
MVPDSPLDSVSATDLVGALLVLWVVALATLLTSGSDPTTPPVWWAPLGLVVLLASSVVAYALLRRAEARGERLGQVWETSPECQHDDRE